MRRRAALAALVALAGCGGSGRATQPAAPPLSHRVLVSGTVPNARPADFAGPIARYRAHVRAQLGAMLSDVAALRAAAGAGRLDAARRAWLAADEHYETIGAAYGAFGDLDAAVNGRADGLPGGIHDARFSGLHRIELALWERASTREATPAAERLAGDVRRLRGAVGHLRIDPFEYALRAHEVLEDALHLQLSGQASPWSGAALVALRGNVRGTEVVLDSLAAMVARRNPRVLAESRKALARVRGALRDVAGPGGALPRWDAVAQRERETIAGLTANATEQLAFVPELVDPRPPRTAPRAFGDGA